MVDFSDVQRAMDRFAGAHFNLTRGEDVHG